MPLIAREFCGNTAGHFRVGPIRLGIVSRGTFFEGPFAGVARKSNR
jgi:hypothetical protein